MNPLASAPLRLLCVFAHPDDEGFGTGGMLVNCVERGVKVHLLTATPGDAGEIADPSLATPETLGEVRRQELAEACEILGAEPPEVLDYPDGGLALVDPAEVERQIVKRIRMLQPAIVVTFDANGGYGHTDHMAIHHRTVAAVAAAADERRFTELGLPPHRADRLYFTAYSRTLFSRMGTDMRRHNTGLDFGSVQTIANSEVGTSDERITTVIDVRRVFDRRWAALRAHRTQIGANNPFYRVPEAVLREWMAADTFVRSRPAFPAGAAIETDILDGLL